MARRLLKILLWHPIQSLYFGFSFFVQILLILLRRLLLPRFPVYQSLRLQIHRAYLSTASITFPNLVHRLPIGASHVKRARRIGTGWTGYVIPAQKDLRDFTGDADGDEYCVALYAHGGGYAKGEARMYTNYMERWENVATQAGLRLVFVSVEYPLSTEAAHPAQRDAFLKAFQFLQDEGVSTQNIIFMGDSAGGGLCVLAAMELARLGLSQPAGSILMSPWIDMSEERSRNGYPEVETDYVITANLLIPSITRLFLGNTPGTSPDVNPLFCSREQVSKLTPQLILAGGADVALRDSEMWDHMLKKAGVRHDFVVELGQMHIYAIGSSFLDPRVRKSTDAKLMDWMKNCIGGNVVASCDGRESPREATVERLMDLDTEKIAIAQ